MLPKIRFVSVTSYTESYPSYRHTCLPDSSLQRKCSLFFSSSLVSRKPSPRLQMEGLVSSQTLWKGYCFHRVRLFGKAHTHASMRFWNFQGLMTTRTMNHSSRAWFWRQTWLRIPSRRRRIGDRTRHICHQRPLSMSIIPEKRLHGICGCFIVFLRHLSRFSLHLWWRNRICSRPWVCEYFSVSQSQCILLWNCLRRRYQTDNLRRWKARI